MGFTPLDYIVVIVYLAVVALFGILAAGKQSTSGDYFLGGRDMPWWAVLFSVVATETSTLTFISIPAVAYGGNLTFMQLTFGYIIGRFIVAAWLLPAYYKGDISTVYEFLSQRFGSSLRSAASSTFIITRVLADGVRLFATAIPLAVILRLAGAFTAWSDIEIYSLAILVIASVTLVYTFLGGIKAVIWMDVVQMVVYVGGAIFAGLLMINQIPLSFSESMSLVASDGKLTMFNWGSGMGWREILADPYVFWIAFFGGGVFAVASHGTDQLIVQRLFATRSLAESRKALIWSGFGASLQFLLFLVIGLLLYIYYLGMSAGELGLQTTDEIFAKYIVEQIPSGLAGLIVAALLAAAMSSLSSSLNALASATTYDLLKPKFGLSWSDETELRTSRIVTIFWGIILSASALFFTWLQLSGGERPAIVELGLGIASYTYGGLLGLFLLGVLFSKPDKWDALIGFFSGLIALLFMVEGPVQNLLPGEGLAIAWPLYTLFGSLIVIAVANLSMWFRQRQTSR